jgi:hypothetical protein
MASKVVHCKRDKYDVYVGRGSKWGNPFCIGVDGTRDEVIEKYHQWILTQPNLLNSLQELKGKTLACHCYPMRCHAQILIDLTNKLN